MNTEQWLNTKNMLHQLQIIQSQTIIFRCYKRYTRG